MTQSRHNCCYYIGHACAIFGGNRCNIFLNQNLNVSFIMTEREKKRQYNRRVLEIEHGSFTPLVFSSYGGCSPETDRFIKELSTKLAEKHGTDSGTMKNWLRTKLSFNLIRSAVLCIRGSRSIQVKVIQWILLTWTLPEKWELQIVSKRAVVFYI